MMTKEERKARRKARRKAYNRKWRLANPDKHKAYDKKWVVNNQDKVKDYQKKWQLANPDKVKAYDKKWVVNNTAKENAWNAKRRAAKLQASPKWLTKFDLDYIKSIYIQAKELEKIDGIERNVDHIVPLKGKTVCGLHVPWNLQILTSIDNLKKSNKLDCSNL